MNREILRLAVPSILANLTVPIVGLVDVAIAGHISDVSAIAGIAVGTMIFDLLYWNFGFLRVGTGGMTAQAFGRGDNQGVIDVLSQNMSVAMLGVLIVWLIGWPFMDLVLMLMPCSADVEEFARQYFSVRIWAAPATLGLMALKGWFIGLQNTVNPMICDIVVNVVNMAASFVLAVYTPLGAVGVAHGTVIAQYTGLVVAVCLIARGFKGYFRYLDFRRSISWQRIRELMVLNGNLIIRSLGFMVIYVGFTVFTSAYGDGTLAVGSIMMKLFMLFSYFIDGFAYAGEAMVGRFIGEQDKTRVDGAVRLLFLWGGGVGAVCTLIYLLWGEEMLCLITSDQTVIDDAHPYLPWLVAMPFMSCVAFMWDGIYVGATAGRQIRDCMLLSAVGFLLAYFALNNIIGAQAIYVGYFVHLIVRSVYLTSKWKKTLARHIGTLKPVVTMLLLCFGLGASAQNVSYEAIDSAYLAGIEEQMIQAEKVQNARKVINLYEDGMLDKEMSFHFDGIGSLVRGTIDSWRHNSFYDSDAVWKERGDDWADYVVAFSPLGVTYGLKVLGVESRSTTKRMLASNALALGFTAGLSSGLKFLTDERKPNGKENNSMPSRHAAMAYASATILHREYGHLSPWVSVGGYGAATATEYLRLHGNHHWAKDIYIGAGIGVVSTNLAYYLVDRILGAEGIHRPRVTMSDMERLLQYNACPSSLTLTSGVEWGSNKEDDVTYGTTFSAGLQYSKFFNQHLALDVSGRLSTTGAFRENETGGQTTGYNIDTYHLDAGVLYSWLLDPAMRLGLKAFGGGRSLASSEDGNGSKLDAECGCGLEINYLEKEKYAVGMSCDYVHAFSPAMTDRFVVNFCWKIIL